MNTLVMWPGSFDYKSIKLQNSIRIGSKLNSSWSIKILHNDPHCILWHLHHQMAHFYILFNQNDQRSKSLKSFNHINQLKLWKYSILSLYLSLLLLLKIKTVRTMPKDLERCRAKEDLVNIKIGQATAATDILSDWWNRKSK